MSTKLRKNENPVMDPQCGKTVDAEKALKVDWEGKTYFFCSETCKERFAVDPPGDAGF